MNTLNVKRLALAFAVTATVLYAGCMIVMSIAGKEQLVFLFNSLLHGIDTSDLIKTDIPLWQAFIGLAQTFIIAWLMGACVAAIYNFSTKKN